LLAYATSAGEPLLKKVEHYLMSQNSWTAVTKSNIVDEHVEHWHNKPLYG